MTSGSKYKIDNMLRSTRWTSVKPLGHLQYRSCLRIGLRWTQALTPTVLEDKRRQLRRIAYLSRLTNSCFVYVTVVDLFVVCQHRHAHVRASRSALCAERVTGKTLGVHLTSWQKYETRILSSFVKCLWLMLWRIMYEFR